MTKKKKYILLQGQWNQEKQQMKMQKKKKKYKNLNFDLCSRKLKVLEMILFFARLFLSVPSY